MVTECSPVPVFSAAVKINAVGTGVGEYSVVYYVYSKLFGFAAKLLKVLFCAKHGVDFAVVACVVTVV